jgi:WD40 repeat protein
VRSHAKASTAGTTQRQAPGLGRIFRGALATGGALSSAKGSGAPAARRLVIPVSVFAAILALMAIAIPASATKTHLFKETFGSAAQPTFTTPRGMAIDQGTGEVLVIEAGSPPSIKRYNPDGTPANFSALATNVIDGAGGSDTTPQGSLAFGVANRVQIAIDESGTATDGDIYVAQAASKVVDVFASSGAYMGQLTESSGGTFGEICGVAVDPAGALYLGDISGAVHKYVPAANPPVKADNTASFSSLETPCQIAAGTGTTAGFIFVNRSNGELFKVDSSTGESKYLLGTGHRTVVVNPATGNVYAPRSTFGSSEVVEYDASGAGSATKVSSLKPGSTIEGVAVRETSADVYLTRSEVNKIQVYGPTVALPDVTSEAVTNNSGTKATLNGTINPDGLALDECFFEWGKTSAYGNIVPCAESPATIGSGTSPVAVHADISALQPNGSNYSFRLVAKNPNGTAKGGNQNFTTPDTVITGAASAITPTSATLNGSVNPDGLAQSECIFEYGLTKVHSEVVQKYPQSAPCVPSAAGIGTGTAPVAVQAAIGGLHPGTVYHYRLKTANPNGPVIGEDTTLQTAGPVIEASWAEDVVIKEAVLKARINPEGAATEYRFEWGTSTAYGDSTEGGVGSDSSTHEVGAGLDGLQPGTTYHYRVVATSGVAENQGPDHTFTTYQPFVPDTDCPNQAFRIGFSANLPDCRAYEMVSPRDKNGGEVLGSDSQANRVAGYPSHISLAGDKISFGSFTAFAGAQSAPFYSDYMAIRTASGWQTEAISPPRTGESNYPIGVRDLPGYKTFSPDLSTGWLLFDYDPPLAPGAPEGFADLYRHDFVGGGYEALNTIVPTIPYPNDFQPELQGLSDDGSHVFFRGSGGLLPGAPFGSLTKFLYEYTEGELRLVSVLPNGEPAAGGSLGTAVIPTAGIGRVDNVEHAISDDGSRVFWTDKSGENGHLFVRIDGATTVPVSQSVTGEASAHFWAASSDGSKVLFTVGTGSINSTLYEFDVDSETPTLIAGGVGVFAESRTVGGVLGAGDDLSRIYFVSREALAPGAAAGDNNLYLDREGDFTFIGALSGRDAALASNLPSAVNRYPFLHSSRVTPDGRYLTFTSNAGLTGYDNADRDTGQPATEAFLYDAEEDELICASCNPSGVRPESDVLTDPAEGTLARAAFVPGWEDQLYASRALAPDGSRLIFNSYDALLPRDTNGYEDVYEWEQQGTGGCQQAGGCIELISSGKSNRDEEFQDATPDGSAIAFNTAARIDPEDPGLMDVYLAAEGGGFPSPPPPPPPCVGDACQDIPAAPNDPTPASAGFRGAGNPQPRKAQRRCRARTRHAARNAKDQAKHKAAKRCKRAKRRAGR